MFGFTHSSSADEESDSESIQFVGVKFEAMRDEANLSDSDGSVDGSNGGNSTSSNSHLGEEDDYVQHNSVEPPQSPSTAATQNNNSPQSLSHIIGKKKNVTAVKEKLLLLACHS